MFFSPDNHLQSEGTCYRCKDTKFKSYATETKPMLCISEFTRQSLDKWALWNCCFRLCFWIKIPCLAMKTALVLKKSVTEVSPPLPRVQLSMNPHFPTTNTSIGKFLPSSQWWALIYSFSKSPELLPESAIPRLWPGRRQPLWDLFMAAIWLCLTGSWVALDLPLLLLTCTSGECAQRSLNLSNTTWIIFISRSEQTEEPMISGGIFLQVVSFSLYYNWFPCGLPLFISFLKDSFLWGNHATDHRQLKKLPWYGPLIWMWKMTLGRVLPLLTLVN